MKKTLAIAAVLVLALVLLTSCGSKGIVGKWAYDMGQAGGIQMEFKGDGTYSASVTLMGQSDSHTGTYSVDGSKLTVDGTTQEFKLDGDKLTFTFEGLGEVTFNRK